MTRIDPSIPQFVQEARAAAKERLIFMEICDHVSGLANRIRNMDHGQSTFSYRCELCGMRTGDESTFKEIKWLI